ncbi:cell division protein [Neisseria meningitidis]|nr:cell division protein [Neisseria meningitidis]
MKIVNQSAHPDLECKFGAAEDETMSEDAIRITIIATGLKEKGAVDFVPAREVEAVAPSKQEQSHNVEGMIRTNRGIRTMNLTAADFDNQSVLDDFEIPAILRRQHNSDK